MPNKNKKKHLLYHGSKSGIVGDIQPISRAFCDFGKGFYMGTDPIQPLTLICNFPEAKLYTVQANLTGLRILKIDIGLDWALLIAYHRGRMERTKDDAIYCKYAEMTSAWDLIIGYIANDRMFTVLDRFFAGEITDNALIYSLSALKLGRQYVALTEKACRQIDVVEERFVGSAERADIQLISERRRKEGIQRADEMCRKYRRDGRFFDEIIRGEL